MSNNISVSFDRTTYPLDSIMYVQVRLSQLIGTEPITIEVFSDSKLLIQRKINPLRERNLTEPPEFLYQISVKMIGRDWKAGKKYFVKAKYENAEAQDSMIIAKRQPVLQTDKPVYIIGSDLIVTLIAPDLDKDSEKPEVVGNRPECTLSISSSCGELKNYKLIETGNSTGIFQGIVGLLPPYSTSKGKRTLNKPRGNGPFTGYLPARIADKIVIKFKSKSGNAELIARTSNFGVAIELDQKIYTPTDKVYVTIVAPDYNYDSRKIDTLGNKPECKLTISTSKGRLENYKLTETGKDTGIFIGEIKLSGTPRIFKNIKTNTKFGKTSGSGPTDGILACSNQDKLKVTLAPELYSISGSALIEFNVGEIVWDSDNYSKNSVAKIRVIDPDMNLDPDKVDKFKIKVWSDSDLLGTTLHVIETNKATGIFEGQIFLGNRTKNKNTLNVKLGDTIYAKYEDFTLPKKFAKTKSLDLIATSKILEKQKPRNTVKILHNSSIPHNGEYLSNQNMTIKAGETVQWINEDEAAHTITSGSVSDGPDGKFDSSMLMSQSSFVVTFDRKGTYPYFCVLHPWKTGKIIVE